MAGVGRWRRRRLAFGGLRLAGGGRVAAICLQPNHVACLAQLLALHSLDASVALLQELGMAHS